MNPFKRKPTGAPPQNADAVLTAYRDGAKDEHARLTRDAEARAKDPALREAFERGRREGAASRRGSPLFVLIALLAVVAVGTVIVLAVREGSFAGAGAVIDNQVANMTATTSRVTSAAADAASQPPSTTPTAPPAPASK